MRRFKWLSALLAAGVVAAGCGSSSGNGGTNGGGGTNASTSVVTIGNESGGTWTCDFNPLNPADSGLSYGPVYEELEFVDTLKSGATTPWLATGYSWSNGDKTLTFTIRSGVKWSDGAPFSASDVVFTFELLKKYPGLDLNSIWSVLSGVSQNGSQVTFNFKTPAVPYFYYVADETPIVPQHIWSTWSNPVSNPDTKPIGTGPFTMSSCTPNDVIYKKNPHYWQPGKPAISEVQYPSSVSNTTTNNLLAAGQAQWGSQFIQGIQSFYLSKSPSYHIWFPPVANVSVFINLKNPILSNVAVRQAMAYAIDRSKVAQLGEDNEEPAANQTGIVTPTFSSWLDTSQANQYAYSYNPAKARSILNAAGYKLSGGVYHTPSGQPLAFTIDNIGGYSDWVASVDVIQQELAAIGIKITPDNLESTAFDSDVLGGNFQLAYDAETGGPTPYYEMRQWLYGPNSAPIGKPAASNFERYSNPAIDTIINDYATTTNSATQHSIVDQLEAVLLKDVPVIPITEEVDWFQYDTAHLQGWPTQADPYAQPAAYDIPDWGVVLVHLAPK
jgi:peptide/nickel transport system substrate-binding protein